MLDCCTDKAPAMCRAGCPECGAAARTVGQATLASLLVAQAVACVDSRSQYFFCRTPGCPVVYFTPGRAARFQKADLRVRVGLKETEPPIPVCYCFGHTLESVADEIQRTGRSTVVERIKAEVKAGNCACEVKNPEGSCCLGNVGQAVKSCLNAQDRQPVRESRNEAIDCRAAGS